jgi:hypothetical protein
MLPIGFAGWTVKVCEPEFRPLPPAPKAEQPHETVWVPELGESTFIEQLRVLFVDKLQLWPVSLFTVAFTVSTTTSPVRVALMVTGVPDGTGESGLVEIETEH